MWERQGEQGLSHTIFPKGLVDSSYEIKSKQIWSLHHNIFDILKLI